MMSASRRFRLRSAAFALTASMPIVMAAASAPAPVTAPAAAKVPANSATTAAMPAAPTPAAPTSATPAPAVPDAAPVPAPLPTQMTVSIDQTRTLDLDRSVSTLSVGNPSIADVSIQNGNHLFLLGKSFGRTNVVALDPSGKTVLDMTVFVTSAGSVTVYKGNRQLTYNCAPNCERALMPGDSKDDFEALSGQINTKSGLGTTASAKE